MPHRFHVSELPDSGRVRLPAETVRHLDVLGLGEGSEVVLFDGTGREATVRIVSVAHNAAEAEVLRSGETSREATPEVTLACAVPKGRRMDTLVRMCAELGVSRIVPLIARRSVVRLPEGDASSHKLDRWRKICVAASEQSGRNVVAAIAPAAGLPTLLEQAGSFDLAVILSPDDSAPTLPALLAAHAGARSTTGSFQRPASGRNSKHETRNSNEEALPRRGSNFEFRVSILLLIGPEGGFTPDEIALALKAGAKPARLTRSILRIETACVAAAALSIAALSE